MTVFRSVFASVATLLIAASPVVSAADLPVKVFVLAGQSNMEGQAVVDLEGKDYNGGRGTLAFLLRDPEKAPRLKHLRREDGGWTVRDDVWCRYQRERGPLLAGPLSVGFAVYGGTHHFGPELQFGHVVGNALENPVLLVKTAWGGKSLYKDFRPPSSGGETGPYYTKMIEGVREALAQLDVEFPKLKGRSTELAGFVWYHGWNDGVDPKNAVPEYEKNLVNLIQDVRKEFKSPKLPVVVGEMTGPWVDAPGEWKTLREAQAAAANRPEFRGNVTFASTRAFVRKPEDSPNPTHGHHEFGNAETYFLVGDALGRAMTSLLAGDAGGAAPKAAVDESSDSPQCEEKKPEEKKSDEPKRQPQPESRTERLIEGWKVRIDDRLLAPPHEALTAKALRFLESRLADIVEVAPADRVKEMRTVTIVLDLDCGDLKSMQYHPSAGWLKAHGFSTELARCVHLPRAADVFTRRNINEQPWVILHELAHAWHDQFPGFDEPRIVEAYEKFKKSGRGDAALLYDGRRVKHYALTDHKEFFAEMTEAFFGANDFYPFNRAELKDSEPELYELLQKIWLAK